MQVFETIAAFRQARTAFTGSLGLVPTMGALHRGHLSLVERARGECERVAVSLFVNPKQFGPTEDFSRYPRQLEADLRLLDAAGVGFVFAPSVKEMYPAGASTFVDAGEMGDRLDGAHRPGHFRGVATVVAKLFLITQPGRAYFGQKDAVQVAVLRRMVRDLNFPLELVACPIVRDADGLALSSRNVYLSEVEREQALVLSRALRAVERAVLDGVRSREEVLLHGLQVLTGEPAVQVEYLAAVDADTLLPVESVAAGTLVAVAARVGATRLIDNIVI